MSTRRTWWAGAQFFGRRRRGASEVMKRARAEAHTRLALGWCHTPVTSRVVFTDGAERALHAALRRSTEGHWSPTRDDNRWSAQHRVPQRQSPSADGRKRKAALGLKETMVLRAGLGAVLRGLQRSRKFHTRAVSKIEPLRTIFSSISGKIAEQGFFFNFCQVDVLYRVVFVDHASHQKKIWVRFVFFGD